MPGVRLAATAVETHPRTPFHRSRGSPPSSRDDDAARVPPGALEVATSYQSTAAGGRLFRGSRTASPGLSRRDGRRLQERPGSAWSPQGEDLEVLAVEAVVRDEEALELLDERRLEVAHAAQVAALGGSVGDRDQAVVADRLATVLRLLRLDHAEQLDWHKAAGVGRPVHQDEHVEGIAVGSAGPREEPEVERKAHAGRHRGFDGECPCRGVVGELVAAPLRRLDDRPETPFLVGLWQALERRHGTASQGGGPDRAGTDRRVRGLDGDGTLEPP